MENKDIIKRLDNLESQSVKLEHKNNLLTDKYFDLESKIKHGDNKCPFCKDELLIFMN